tara:strand:- start:2179 stop:2346 length:168 start_codon:yes stop_codon:yes gene_type:complete
MRNEMETDDHILISIQMIIIAMVICFAIYYNGAKNERDSEIQRISRDQDTNCDGL